KRTGYLAMIGNVATQVGLLGTIIGLIQCFAGVAGVDASEKARVLSDGIAEAMNCTAFGLIVAIPALVAFSLLQGRTQRRNIDIPKVNGVFDRKSLGEKLKTLKTSLPDQTAITVQPEDSVAYADLVETVDTAMGEKLRNVTVAPAN